MCFVFIEVRVVFKVGYIIVVSVWFGNVVLLNEDEKDFMIIFLFDELFIEEWFYWIKKLKEDDWYDCYWIIDRYCICL